MLLEIKDEGLWGRNLLWLSCGQCLVGPSFDPRVQEASDPSSCRAGSAVGMVLMSSEVTQRQNQNPQCCHPCPS